MIQNLQAETTTYYLHLSITLFNINHGNFDTSVSEETITFLGMNPITNIHHSQSVKYI